LTLRLGGPPLALRGRVLHADGKPVVNVQVTLLEGEEQVPDGLEFTADGMQAWIAGRPVDSEGGEFEIRGLDERDYRLRVLDPASHAAMVSAPLRPGTAGIELRLPPRGARAPLRGIVVDRDGRPVPGADWSFERPAPEGFGPAVLTGPFLHADADGRLEWPALAAEVDKLLVKAPGMAEFERIPLAAFPDLGAVRVTVAVGCQARVEAADEGADAVTFVDARGRSVPVVLTHGNRAWGAREVQLAGGSSQTFMAPDDLVELVLWRQGVELRRAPVALRRDGLNVLRP
jgi:hypothetical protein